MQEKNRHILKQAIASLSDRKAPKATWLTISRQLDEIDAQGQEHFEKACKNVRKNLVEAPDIWDKITESLDQMDEMTESEDLNPRILKDAVNALPQHQSPGNLFDNIIDRVETGKKSKKLIFNRRYQLSGIAAMILLVMSISFWLNRDTSQKDTNGIITYSEEIVPPADNINTLLSSFEQEDEVLAFVEANCLQIELKCDNDEFKGLLSQYKELDTVKQTLMAEIAAHREQVRLMDYLVRVEKEKTEVGKKLIQYLLS